MFTTTSMMADSVSIRTLHIEVKPATSMKRNISMTRACSSPQTKPMKIGQERMSERPIEPVVTAMATLSPI